MTGRLLDAAWTVAAFILLSLVVIVAWLVISVPAYAIKLAALALRYDRMLEWVRTRLLGIRPLDAWRAGYGLMSGAKVGSEQSVRLIVDERLKILNRTLRQTVQSVSKASLDMVGLGGTTGPNAFATDLRTLQEKIEEVSALGGEIEEDMIRHYQGRSTATFMFYTCLVLAVAFGAVNGTLLNLFFQGVIEARVFGIPASYPVSVIFIFAELGLGLATAWFVQRQSTVMQYVLITLIVAAALFEAIIFGIVSNGFDLEIALFDDHPWMKSWMAILGVLLVSATATTGYMLHQTRHQIDEHKGALRLRRDVIMTNSFVRSLPTIWDSIRHKAQSAEASINSYLMAIGNKAGALKGAVDQIATERETIVQALAAANVDDWRNWLDGEAGDRRHHGYIQIGLALLSVMLIAMFVWGFRIVLAMSYPATPPLAGWTGAVLTAAAFCAVGLLSLGRVQVSETGKYRVYALRSEPWEYVVGGVAGLCAILAVLWASAATATAPGIAFGLLLVAGGGGLAMCGYYLDQVAAGLVTTIRAFFSFVLGTLAAVLLLLLIVLGWPFWALAWLLFFLLSILAWPAEKLVEYYQARRAARASGGRPVSRESPA